MSLQKNTHGRKSALMTEQTKQHTLQSVRVLDKIPSNDSMASYAPEITLITYIRVIIELNAF